MQVTFTPNFESQSVDAKVIILYKDYDETLIPEELKAELEVLRERETFDLEKFGFKKFYASSSVIYLCSLGKEMEEAELDDLRFLAYKVFTDIRNERFASVAIRMQKGSLTKPHSYFILAERASMVQYKFDKFKSGRKDNRFETLYIVDQDANMGLEEAVKEALLLAEAQKTARALVDEPANKLRPSDLAKKAVEQGAKSGFDVEVFEREEIEKFGMEAYLSVARGSANPPKLIVMRYRGAKKGDTTYGLVGKGLCFDSGGYSLKPSTGMDTMKLDMGGAATVIGAMQAIAEAKLPVNVVAVVASCENLIGPEAYFPGDIIGSMAGKTIFVKNTDAEGRLTLIDAITYIIRKENADTVFDFATLTGAAMAAFGYACAPTLTNDEDIYAEFKQAAEIAGEKIWRMPIFPEYKELIKNDEADLTNSAGNPGMITAGMFVGEFVEDKPWIHVDIAPTAYVDKQSGFYDKGATGFGVKTVYEFMKTQK